MFFKFKNNFFKTNFYFFFIDYILVFITLFLLLSNHHHHLTILLISLNLIYYCFFSSNYNFSTIFKYILIFNVLNLSLIFFCFYKFFFLKNNLGFNMYLSNSFFNMVNLPVCFYIDFLSINVSLLTNLLLVILLNYSYFYMKKDLSSQKFIMLIQFFGLSMLLFLCSGDVLSLFLGWELVGLSSFLLINFWTYKVSSLKSALKAFSFNKFSDFFFFLFLIIFLSSNTSNLASIYGGCCYYSFDSYSHLSFLFLCFCGFFKSVQFGFHIWLPDSMEAPMPASALIHSATLISAGLYITSRFSPYINIYFKKLYLLSIFTVFYGSVCSFMQTDLKRILAYSTISHCGYMYIPIFFNNQEVFILYFYIHGFTKALCFLIIGLFIQDLSLYQDSRKVPVFFQNYSFEYYISLPTIFSLGGLPFFFGFLSKYYLVGVINSYFIYNIFYILFDLSSLSATFYCINLFKNLFFGKKSSKPFYFYYFYNYQKFNIIYIIYLFFSSGGLFLVFYYMFLLDLSLNGGFFFFFKSMGWSFYIYKAFMFIFFFKLFKDWYLFIYIYFIYCFIII